MPAIKIIKRTVELGGNVMLSSFPDPIPASFFNDETAAHMFVIYARQDGQPFSFVGNVSGSFLNDNNETVPIYDGYVLSDGAACITLPDACYQVPGSFTLTISVSGAVVYECCGTIKVRSSTTAYDPSGVITDISALASVVADLHAAAAAAAVPATDIVAPQYRNNSDYAVGSYVVQDGKLYRCKVEILMPGEEWNLAHWDRVYTMSEVSEVSALRTLVGGRTDNSQVTVTSGGYVSAGDGTVGATSDGNYGYTSLIDVSKLRGLLCSICSIYQNFIGVAFYDASQQYVSGINGYAIGSTSNDPKRINFTIPSNAYYARITANPYISTDPGYYTIYCVHGLDMLNDNVEKALKFYDDTAKNTTPTGHGYIDIYTGNFVSNNSYISGQMYVLPGDSVQYFCGTTESVAGIAFMSADGSYISGYAGTQAEQTIIVPDNAAIVKYCFRDVNIYYGYVKIISSFDNIGKQIYLLKTGETYAVVDQSGGGDYTSILAALKGTDPSVHIIIRKGTYNIITEYTDYYGQTFWQDYQGYIGYDDLFLRGLWMETGRKIRGESGVVIECVNPGGQAGQWFSVFANHGGTLLENVTIRFGGIRYAIHDDFSPLNDTVEWRNIRFICDGQSTAIGGGLGNDSTYIIDGCVFDTPEDTETNYDINYHGSNNALTTNKCAIRVTNCRGGRGCTFWSNGPSEAISECYVSNSRFKDIVCTTPSGNTENMRLTQWCNITEADENAAATVAETKVFLGIA